MRRLWKCVVFCSVIAAVFWCTALLSDRAALRQELIRLHVVANSDSEKDQMVKLQVRDAVIGSIQEDLRTIGDIEEAKAYLLENLPKIQKIANETLRAAGFEEETVVTLCSEAFDLREYDTFTLPAGVYESLRIVIGEGAGKNWWCVAFPALCLPATATGFADSAVEAGLSQPLTDTLRREEGYEVRFFLLDALGRLENILLEG